MFKLIFLVVALSGQPKAVFAYKQEFPVCPPAEVSQLVKIKMQFIADGAGLKVEDPICVPSEKVREEAERLLGQKES